MGANVDVKRGCCFVLFVNREFPDVGDTCAQNSTQWTSDGMWSSSFASLAACQNPIVPSMIRFSMTTAKHESRRYDGFLGSATSKRSSF